MASVISASNFSGINNTVSESASPPDEIESHDEDILQDMDDGQLREYKSMLCELGNFADKVLINTLSMIAEDYSVAFPKSSSNIYYAIRDLLLSRDVRADCKLPLVYVIDSILKNVRGDYIQIMQNDIHSWMGDVFQMLGNDDTAQTKLRKVWNTWKEFDIFPEEPWKKMGRCFPDTDLKSKAANIGIPRAPDGSLKLPINLRKKMQFVLDEMQNGDVQELHKVSLERLADINPDLLKEIKKAADEMPTPPSDSSKSPGSSDHPLVPDLFPELRPPEVLERCAEWEKLSFEPKEKTDEIVCKLLQYVTSETLKPRNSNESCDVTKLLGASSATAIRLKNMLERLTSFETSSEKIDFSEIPTKPISIDTSKFTTDGIKEKNDIAIACLYELGLPFISISDGRRFRTQLALSKHFDELFQSRNERVMEVTQERGWYQSNLEWSGLISAKDPTITDLLPSNNGETKVGDISQIDDAKFSTVTADDSRIKCVLCGSNFEQNFDQEEGEWKYSNCCEANVLNNDAAEKECEAVLVHVTCWRGLGSPEFLTMDQVQNNCV